MILCDVMMMSECCIFDDFVCVMMIRKSVDFLMILRC